ncbi:MAG: hypothetical protein JSS14_17360 [Proteobacteria bacterium]|nr:hypothetical protein [Pseudomonadota bacterium]
MPVLCGACSAENRDAAKFCKGCGRKIAQAWPQAAPVVSTAGAEALPDIGASTLSRPAAAPKDVRPTPAPPRATIGNGRWIVGLGVGVVLLVLAVAWWGYKNRSQEIAQPVQPALKAPGIPAPTPAEARTSESAPAVMPAPAPPSAPVEAPPARSESAPVAQEQQASPKPTKRAAKKQAPPPSAPTVAAEPPPPPVAAPEPARVPTPQESCAGRNFIARAQCMADQCARPELARHPQCEAVRQQQRIEEEKRNPTMAG